MSRLPFSDITCVLWGPGHGLRCYLYTAPLETAPVLPRHPQSLAAAIRIPEDGLACAKGTVYPSLGPGVGVPIHTAHFRLAVSLSLYASVKGFY